MNKFFYIQNTPGKIIFFAEYLRRHGIYVPNDVEACAFPIAYAKEHNLI